MKEAPESKNTAAEMKPKVLNWDGRAGKRTNRRQNNENPQEMNCQQNFLTRHEKAGAEYPPRVTQKVSKARFYWNPKPESI